MNEPLALNHLHLPAKDPAFMRRWYVEKLDFRLSGNLLWSGGTLLVFGEGEPLDTNMLHFGFRISSLDELWNWQRTLLERGVEAPQPQGDQHYQCFRIYDPSGYELEFFFEASGV